jgi:hypothetical protein
MAFDLEKLLVDVFAPQKGDAVTVMVDLPHGQIADNAEWRKRREMAESWRKAIVGFSERLGLSVNALVTFDATGSHNSDLPEQGRCGSEAVPLEEVIQGSSIVLSMTEYSASAPLFGLVQKNEHLRVASMPMVTQAMEERALSADYKRIAETCSRLAPHFERAEGIEVTFSTGHQCYFDLSAHNQVFQDNGQLHPGKENLRCGNLPAGEVCACPNESEESRTAGEIPAVIGDEDVVFVVKHNRIVDVAGQGPTAEKMRREFRGEPALCNIAEVAIGCNDQAAVTGNVLEDEKAGFHWAYGRSDHLGGKTGVSDFSSPDKVFHKDIVYAKGNPIVCQRLDFVFPDGTRKTAVVDGVPSL